jgi:phage terminase large subunit-like protein
MAGNDEKKSDVTHGNVMSFQKKGNYIPQKHKNSVGIVTSRDTRKLSAAPGREANHYKT